MAFFDKLTSIAQSAVDKTNEMLEINKLDSGISAEKAKITELKRKIGEYYWDKFLENEQLDEEPAGLCAEIRACEAAIASIQAELQARRDETSRMAAAAEPVRAEGRRCPSCDAVNPEGSKFCHGCGYKLETPVAAENILCACGAQNPPGTKFCSGCGNKLL